MGRGKRKVGPPYPGSGKPPGGLGESKLTNGGDREDSKRALNAFRKKRRPAISGKEEKKGEKKSEHTERGGKKKEGLGNQR